MTTRQPHIEIITTDAGVHCAIVGGNGETVWTTEVYTDHRTAVEAIGLLSGVEITGAVRYVDQRTQPSDDDPQDTLPVDAADEATDG